MKDEAEHRQLPFTFNRRTSSHLKLVDFVFAFLLSALIVSITAVAFGFHMPPADYTPEVRRLLIRLVEADGLDPCAVEARSPVFRLAVDADGVSERTRWPCAGGGGAMLRVSYRGVILAWGGVPRFCVDGGSMRGPSATVARVVATSEGSVLRREMQNMIRAEAQAFGDVEFDVDGELPGLGRLHCKTYLFQDEQGNNALPPCTFQA